MAQEEKSFRRSRGIKSRKLSLHWPDKSRKCPMEPHGDGGHATELMLGRSILLPSFLDQSAYRSAEEFQPRTPCGKRLCNIIHSSKRDHKGPSGPRSCVPRLVQLSSGVRTCNPKNAEQVPLKPFSSRT